MRRDAGVTLMEVLIAVTLLSVLSVGMMLAMRIGISALWRTDRKLMDNRRVAGAQRVLEQELQGLIPVIAPCGAKPESEKVIVFSGQTNSITMISSFSLQQAWRGRPQIIELFTMPDDQGAGIRLAVNEIPYTGARGAGELCTGTDPVPESVYRAPRFAPPHIGPTTFILADHLRAVRFQYLRPAQKPNEPSIWSPTWGRGDWPSGIRIEMEPLEPSPARLQPITVSAPIYVNRDPGAQYADH